MPAKSHRPSGRFGVLLRHIMKREDHSRRILEIVDRLSELLEKDRAILQVKGARSSPFISLDLKQLFACSEHREARKNLHDELRALASEKIED